MPLECITFMSAIIASHGNGLKGCSFIDWLRYFIRELDVNAEYGDEKEDELPEVSVPVNFDMTIPYCVPMVNTEWNGSIYDYLASIGAVLGSVHGNFGNTQSRDFCMKLGNKEIISGECKFWNEGDNVGSRDLNLIIDRLIKRKCSINIIVVAKFVDDISLIEWASKVEYRIYLLKRGEDNKFSLIELNKIKGDTCFILMDLDTLISNGKENLERLRMVFR